MQPGSLVLTVDNFDRERQVWPINYPRKGDILTVKFMGRNTDRGTIQAKELIMNLWFEELPLPIGLADKRVGGTPNFIEIQSPEEAMEILNSLENEKDNSISKIIVDQI